MLTAWLPGSRCRRLAEWLGKEMVSAPAKSSASLPFASPSAPSRASHAQAGANNPLVDLAAAQLQAFRVLAEVTAQGVRILFVPDSQDQV
jgi:hypothetical protein